MTLLASCGRQAVQPRKEVTHVSLHHKVAISRIDIGALEYESVSLRNQLTPPEAGPWPDQVSKRADRAMPYIEEFAGTIPQPLR